MSSLNSVKDMPLVRKDSFCTSYVFLYILLLFGIPLSFTLYWSGVDGFISQLGFHFWQIRELQDLFAYLSILGQAASQIAVCLLVAALYYRKGMYMWAYLWLYSIVIYLGVGLIGYAAKSILGRPRPKMYKEMYDFQWLELSARLHSFPSGHTITTFAWLACLVPFYGTKTRVAMFLFATIVSLGRVGITAHYLGDVVLAAVMGYAIASVWVKEKGFGTADLKPKNKLELFFISKFKSAWVKILNAK